MRKSTKMVKLYSGLLAAAVTASTFGGAVMTAAVPVFADGVETRAGSTAQTYTVTNGSTSFGQGTASITIQGKQDDENERLENKKFEVFKLFDAENSQHGESINYTFNPMYKHALQTVVAGRLNEINHSQLTPDEVTEYMVIDYIQMYLNNHEVEGADADQILESNYSDFRYFVEDVRDQIKAENLYGDYVVVKSASTTNAIVIGGLQYGYYIVDEVSTQDQDGGDYYASSLIMVDTANPNAQINIKSDNPNPPVKKVQEDDNADVIGNDGWNDVGTAEIGQTVPFELTYEVTDLNGFESYYWAVHDKMSQGLRFHDSKDEISITITKGEQSYTLEDTEYNVHTSGAALDEGDTFVLEITDLKNIIDREIQNPVDPDDYPGQDTTGYNDYSDMTVTVNYVATVTDQADTGLPGNENSFRVEYSQDPDSEGDGETSNTPWDTVVVFTFKLDGLKVNDHDNALEGAKFRLYSDEACTQEVYVKANTSADSISALAATDNVTSPDGTEEDFDGNTVTVGGNGYTVINRDSVGGDDHTGGTRPGEAVDMVSDADGNFTIYGLDEGTYWLKEVDAPDGYRPLLDPIEIKVIPTIVDRNNYVAGQPNKVLTKLEATAHIKEFYDGEYKEGDATLTTDMEDGSMNIKIVNEVGTKLPVTGSSAMLVMLGAGVALMGGAVVLSRKKKVAR